MDKIPGIYVIDSIIKPEKFYIGSSINMFNRKQRHLTELKCQRHKNAKLQAHYNKYGIADLKFGMLEEVPEKNNLIGREQLYLDTFLPIFNICVSAKNSLGVKRTDTYKLQMSLSKKGKPHRPECKAEKSLRMMGRKGAVFQHTDKAKANITLNHRNKKITLQYDLQGNFIKEWDFVVHASVALNLCKMAISVCCKGKIKTSGGFRWAYAPYRGFRHSVEEMKLNGRTFKKEVLQYDLDDSFIREWPVMQDAALELKIAQSTISMCCHGKNKSAGGFIWKFKNLSNAA